jgi:hypothetical protein
MHGCAGARREQQRVCHAVSYRLFNVMHIRSRELRRVQWGIESEQGSESGVSDG